MARAASGTSPFVPDESLAELDGDALFSVELHTQDHPFLSRCDPATQADQIRTHRGPCSKVASRGTLNLHHGIAPLIRGTHSVYWAVWEGRPEWLGATVHRIDEGIDSGLPLAYCHPAGQEKTRSVPELFALATERGVAALVKCLERIERAEVWSEPLPPGPRAYRSTFSGWRMLGLKIRKR